MKMKLKGALISAALALGVTGASSAFAAWEPNKPVEFIIPAGPGGGADQMARMIQGIITKNNLMKQAIIPVNKGAGAGAAGDGGRVRGDRVDLAGVPGIDGELSGESAAAEDRRRHAVGAAWVPGGSEGPGVLFAVSGWEVLFHLAGRGEDAGGGGKVFAAGRGADAGV